MGTNYYQNTKEKPSHTHVYYKDNENNLHIIRADTLDVEEARATVEDVLNELEASKGNYCKPVLALVEGGIFDEKP